MGIMFINQQEVLTTFDKYRRFCGLVTLSKRTKEECYMDLVVVMRHHNKAGFSVKCIECDGYFKSIMDEVSNEMEIYMNDENPDGQVTESESKNILIKDWCKIAYYRLSYKKIPRIMIHHLAMNVAKNLNMFF